MTRDRVIALALERAPQVMDADARILESRGRLSGARILAANPTVELLAGDPGSRRTRLEAELTIPVGPGLRRSRRIRLAGAEVRRDESLARDARRLAVGAALGAYYRVLHAMGRVDVANQRLSLAERLRAGVEERLNSGDVARLDLQVAETEASRSRSEVLVEQLGLADATTELARVLGLPSVSGLVIAGNLADESLLEARAETPELDDRPDIQAATDQLEAARAEQALARTATLPELAFRLNYHHEEDLSEWMPGVAISIPIFDRGQGGRAEARARSVRAQRELDRRMSAASAEREAAWLAHETAVASVRELVQGALPRAVEVESLSEQSYLSGKTDLGTLLAFRREALDTRREYVDRLLEAALRGVDVGLAIGLWP